MGEKYGKLGKARLLRTANVMVKSLGIMRWILFKGFYFLIKKKSLIFFLNLELETASMVDFLLFHAVSAAACWLRYMHKAGKLILSIGWKFSFGFWVGPQFLSMLTFLIEC